MKASHGTPRRSAEKAVDAPNFYRPKGFIRPAATVKSPPQQLSKPSPAATTATEGAPVDGRVLPHPTVNGSLHSSTEGFVPPSIDNVAMDPILAQYAPQMALYGFDAFGVVRSLTPRQFDEMCVLCGISKIGHKMYLANLAGGTGVVHSEPPRPELTQPAQPTPPSSVVPAKDTSKLYYHPNSQYTNGALASSPRSAEDINQLCNEAESPKISNSPRQAKKQTLKDADEVHTAQNKQLLKLVKRLQAGLQAHSPAKGKHKVRAKSVSPKRLGDEGDQELRQKRSSKSKHPDVIAQRGLLNPSDDDGDASDDVTEGSRSTELSSRLSTPRRDSAAKTTASSRRRAEGSRDDGAAALNDSGWRRALVNGYPRPTLASLPTVSPLSEWAHLTSALAAPASTSVAAAPSVALHGGEAYRSLVALLEGGRSRSRSRSGGRRKGSEERRSSISPTRERVAPPDKDPGVVSSWIVDAARRRFLPSPSTRYLDPMSLPPSAPHHMATLLSPMSLTHTQSRTGYQ